MDVDVPGNIRAVRDPRRAAPVFRTRGDPVPAVSSIGDLRDDQRALSRGTLCCQRAPDRGDAVLEPADAAAIDRIGATDAVVTDFDPERRGRRGCDDAHVRRARVLGDIGESLGHDEIGRGFDSGGKSPIGERLDSCRHGRTFGQGGDRRPQTRLGQDRRVDPASELT